MCCAYGDVTFKYIRANCFATYFSGGNKLPLPQLIPKAKIPIFILEVY